MAGEKHIAFPWQLVNSNMTSMALSFRLKSTFGRSLRSSLRVFQQQWILVGHFCEFHFLSEPESEVLIFCARFSYDPDLGTVTIHQVPLTPHDAPGRFFSKSCNMFTPFTAQINSNLMLTYWGAGSSILKMPDVDFSRTKEPDGVYAFTRLWAAMEVPVLIRKWGSNRMELFGYLGNVGSICTYLWISSLLS